MSRPFVVGWLGSVEQETRSGAHASWHGMLASSPAGASAVIRGWMARSQQRRALGGLDDRLLRDIGVSRQQALREAAKWFWQR